MARYREKPPRKSNTGLVVGLVLGGAGLLLVLVVGGCVGFLYLGKKDTTKQAVQQLPTRDEFRAKWVGKTSAELLAALGKPESTDDYQGSPTVTWHYGELFGSQAYARDPVTDKPERFVRFEIGRDGVIIKVEF